MAYITVSTDDGDFLEYHTATKDDEKVKSFLLDRAMERGLAVGQVETVSVEEIQELLTGNHWK